MGTKIRPTEELLGLLGELLIGSHETAVGYFGTEKAARTLERAGIRLRTKEPGYGKWEAWVADEIRAASLSDHDAAERVLEAMAAVEEFTKMGRCDVKAREDQVYLWNGPLAMLGIHIGAAGTEPAKVFRIPPGPLAVGGSPDAFYGASSPTKPWTKRDIEMTKKDPSSSGAKRVFVSHSSVDAVVAQRFVELLRTALRISSKNIRCTSVDGYRLDAGSNSNEQLRQEVFESDVFVALLSPQSLRSIYVAFELGARWGSGRYLAPIMIRGLTPSDLKQPLSSLHAISGESQPDLYQLIDKVGHELGLEVEPPPSYLAALTTFITSAKPDDFPKGDEDDSVGNETTGRDPIQMLRPSDMQRPLTANQGEAVAQLLARIQEKLKTSDEYVVNWVAEQPRREEVWHEVVRQADRAGWNATIRGAIVTISHPRRGSR